LSIVIVVGLLKGRLITIDKGPLGRKGGITGRIRDWGLGVRAERVKGEKGEKHASLTP
jgi:hypothetical protein